jgi:fatty-acyl-CoA synthase
MVAMRVVAETADIELLRRDLRTSADIAAIERVPLEERLRVVDFYERLMLALEARRAAETAISFVPDGDVRAPVEETSFGKLRHKTELMAALLRSRGIGHGDVVAIVMPTIPAAYWTLMGTMAQAIPFPVNWMLEPDPLLELLRRADAKAVIALGPTPDFRIWESLQTIRKGLRSDAAIWSVAAPGWEPLAESDLERQLEQLGSAGPLSAGRTTARAEEIAAYVHSGGTTGLPKIVKISHGNISYRHWTLQLAMQLTLGEVVLQDTPIFHIGGIAGRCLPMLACGASLVIPSMMGARDKRYVANYWKFVERFRVTRLSGVPTTLSALTRMPPQGEDLSSLRRNFVTGSTALPISVRREFEQASGVRILNSYGLTENTASVAIELRDCPPKQGSSGVPVPHTQVRAASSAAADGDWRESAPGEIGMLLVKGPGVSLGYVGHVPSTRTADGWLITGDLGRIDSDGVLFVTGRAKDIIIRGGHNIDPGSIEDALLRSPEVLHAAAVGKPDSYAGELPIAYVQLVPGSRITGDELIAVAGQHIAERAAIPKEIYIVDRIPLTGAGKPSKVALRHDAAKRVFRTALTQALEGVLPADAWDVEVHGHPVHGTMVTISIAQRTGFDTATVEAVVGELMSRYSFAYEITWRA